MYHFTYRWIFLKLNYVIFVDTTVTVPKEIRGINFWNSFYLLIEFFQRCDFLQSFPSLLLIRAHHSTKF